MVSKILFVAVMAVVVYQSSLTAAQAFGGVNRLPGGGRSQQFGYQAGPAWGSISQSHDRHGFGTPITYSGGVNTISQQGTGVSGSLAMQPGIGGQGTVRGQVGLLNSGNHHANAFAQHDRFLNRDLRPVGPETNSAGINYVNKNGASAFASGSQTHGMPATGTVGGSIPIYTNKNGGVSATAQTTFGHGMKPIPQVGIQAGFNF